MPHSWEQTSRGAAAATSPRWRYGLASRTRPHRPWRSGIGRRDGHRPVRLHTHPAADDVAGRVEPGWRGRPRDRQLRRLPRWSARGCGSTPADPDHHDVAVGPRRRRRESGADAADARRDRLAGDPHGRRFRERRVVRDRRRLDARPCPGPVGAAAGVGLRRRGARHRPVGRHGAGPARRRVAHRMVGGGGTRRGGGGDRMAHAGRGSCAHRRPRPSPRVRGVGSWFCWPATPSKGSGTSSRERSSSRPSARPRRAGWATAPGCWSGWRPHRRRRCGRWRARDGHARRCSWWHWSFRPRGSPCPHSSVAPHPR